MAFETLRALKAVIEQPSLARARALEQALVEDEYDRRVFGRFNQRSSIEANSESDRGIAERLANAFDTSLTAARLATGLLKSDRSLTPRVAAQRFFAPDRNVSTWEPQDGRIAVGKPVIEFWEESVKERQRYRKFQPEDGLATVLVRDFGTGVSRREMPETILALNSDAKLRTFEAIGQFGHGGSSSLFFCESALLITQPRVQTVADEAYWTLIFPEREPEDSKQELLRKWFSEKDGLPLRLSVASIPGLSKHLPGTSIWHFGYYRGGWIKRITGPEQSNPWGRLGRLFFSYPLPFEVRGALARGDANESTIRTITSPFHRLVQAVGDAERVQYFAPEKTERLLVEGTDYGAFSFLAFVLPDTKDVRNYVDQRHPVIFTLNGQNHGETTSTVLTRANLPELSSTMIVEVRLDGLDQEALSHIVANSRETPKSSVFTRALHERLVELLKADEGLQEMEARRQDQKARQSSQELNKRLSQFISQILSDAVGQASAKAGRTAPGGGGGGGGERRPEVPAHDPPLILEFISGARLVVPEGATYLAKFRSDARPPRYTFQGDNPRLFARYMPTGDSGGRVSMVGHAEINDRGYGSVSLHCSDDRTAPILEVEAAGRLELTLQSTDGRVLTTSLEIAIAPRPQPKERARERDVRVQILFCAPGGDAEGRYAELLNEETVTEFGASLTRFKEALQVMPEECAYWGERFDNDGANTLTVEINAANTELVRMLQSCATAEERVAAKERYCRDVALDAYQHCFRLDDLPEAAWDAIQGQDEDTKRAAEILLNHDKAIRFALHERDNARRKQRSK